MKDKGFFSNLFSKKDNIDYDKNQIVNQMGDLGYSFLGNSLSSCGEIKISLKTFYEIQKYSTEAQAYKDKIVSWIGKDIYLEDVKGNIIDNEKLLSEVRSIFDIPTFQMLKQQYFINTFCSGEIYLYPKQDILGNIKVQVVDSRTIEKDVDKFGNIIGYKQPRSGKKIKRDDIYNSVSRYNPNNPAYGQSLYESIVYDALSEKESSRRQFYFFKNNAVPNSVFILNPEVATRDNVKQTQDMINEKFKGTSNSNKPMVSNAIQDVKVLDISNKELDLINLREFFTKKMGMVFQIDPRLIGFVQDVGAYNSIQAIREEAKNTLNAFSTQLENDLNNFYKIFIDKKFPYKIKLQSESFEDKEEQKKSLRADFGMGAITLNEYREILGKDTYKEDWANNPILESKYKIPMQNINN